MFFEQYEHEPNIAVARFWLHVRGGVPDSATLAEKQEGGRRALAAMEHRLAGAEWLVDGGFTLADVALYAYTHVAHEAGIDLAPYPGIRAWIDRVAARPGHITLDD
ncbi:MAG: glutathione binding-like protein [Thermoleophilia bacterium]